MYSSHYEKLGNSEICIDNEIPFKIPDNWIWIRLKNVTKIRNGFTPNKADFSLWDSKDIPWFTIADKNKQGNFISFTHEYISKKAINNSSDRIVPKDSVLLCCTASIGEFAYNLIGITTNQQWNGLTSDKRILSSMYLYYWVQTIQKNMINSAGTTTFPFLSTKKLSMFLLPLPSLAEQSRIVEVLNQLLPICEELNF